MTAKFTGSWGTASRANLALTLTLFTTGSALAGPATPEQKKACTPDVYRFCAGEIPDVRAITACLRRQRASLSDACRAVFEQ
jgi:hypothetical protein